MAERAERCATCRFWWRWPETEFGDCRRYPPLGPLDGSGEANFSHSTPEDWCGEYQACTPADSRETG